MKRAAAVVPLLLLVAACGGKDGKAQYLSKAEALCTKINEQRTQLQNNVPTEPAELPAYVDKVLATARDASSQLSALEAPEQDRAQIDAKVLQPLRAQVADAEAFGEKLKAAARKNDGIALLNLLQTAPTGTRVDVTFMRDYGFKACADAADTSTLTS